MNFKEFSLPVKILIYCVLCVILLTVVLPIFWMTYTAFKTPEEIFESPFSLPRSLYLENFKEAWKLANFTLLYRNSLIITIVSVSGLMLFCSAAGYAFARFRFRGSHILFLYFLAGMMIPPQVIMIPGFKVMSMLRLRNTLFSVIFTYLAWVPFAIFFFRAYFLGIPKELADAARIDGASELGIFWRIMLPLATPALVTVGIFYFVWIFNDFLWPLIYLQEARVRTVTLGMMNFQGRYTSLWNLQMAALSIATWPPIIVYLLLRKRIQKGLTEGALKM